MTNNEQLKKDVEAFFTCHFWTENSEVIDKIIIEIENEFCRHYGYSWNEIDPDYLIEKTHEEVWKMTSFILDWLTEEQERKIAHLLRAKENVKDLLEKPNTLIDMHGLEYWAWRVEKLRNEVKEIL